MPSPKPLFAGFEVLSRLGEGGQSDVFLAERADTGRCALKVLRRDVEHDPAYLECFRMEADIGPLLLSRHLVRTWETGEFEGRMYIAMELVDGPDLGLLSTRLRKAGAPLPVEFCCYVVTQLLDGLACLHEAKSASGEPLGLLHRDVTPHNVFCSFDGRVVLGDFGLAHARAHGEARGAVGKAGYLAPESLSGAEYDHRADLFATGIVLWELLTGRRLFEGPDAEVLARVAAGDVPRPSKLDARVPPVVEKVVMHALQRRPKDRFESARAFQTALQPHFPALLCNEPTMSSLIRSVFAEELARSGR